MPEPAWHILTGEYPPNQGGVSDYTRAVACGLAAAGDEVHVWAPSGGQTLAEDPGVVVHALPRGYDPRDLRAIGRSLRAERGPRRVLVQYVPQAFGMKGLNVPFCAWVAGLRDTEVFVMFHEVRVSWRSLRLVKWNMAAAAMRAMTALLLARADRVFLSTSSWEPMLRALAVRWRGATWLPIPSNIPLTMTPGARAATRARLGIPEDVPLVGHFGTYGDVITPLLRNALQELLATNPGRWVLLVGHGADDFARTLPSTGRAAGQIVAVGALDATQVASHLSACDVVIQPYPDGISTRRTSAMAPLALGLPVATCEGRYSETVWRESGAVELVTSGDRVADAAERLLSDPERAAALGKRGKAVYAERFSIEHTIRALRGDAVAR